MANAHTAYMFMLADAIVKRRIVHYPQPVYAGILIPVHPFKSCTGRSLGEDGEAEQASHGRYVYWLTRLLIGLFILSRLVSRLMEKPIVNINLWKR